ncbi:5-oxoprolinase subunit PxpA [Nocardioides sp.]|uniref:5-oxoprolinase subunit PxpA n=1 Tax=Nocardioides sp. TaxID=35761 RepID=UPI003D107E99
MAALDLNADLGEEVTDDEGLLALVTSANVACGYHAGNAEIMRRVCAEAVRRGVTIGAQVSYADRENFGRIPREVPLAVLREQVADQVGVLSEIAASEGGAVGYVKPHGALYHRVIDDAEQAGAVLSGSAALPLLGMGGAVILSMAAQAGRRTFLEGFPDRAYTSAGRLVPRGEPHALVEDSSAIAANAVRLAARVDSVCVHGDSPDAVAHARAVRRALLAADYVLRPFA